MYFADETAKVFQDFRNIEEWRQQVVKKVIDEYAGIRVREAEIGLSQGGKMSNAIRKVDLGEDIQDFIEVWGVFAFIRLFPFFFFNDVLILFSSLPGPCGVKSRID